VERTNRESGGHRLRPKHFKFLVALNVLLVVVVKLVVPELFLRSSTWW